MVCKSLFPTLVEKGQKSVCFFWVVLCLPFAFVWPQQIIIGEYSFARPLNNLRRFARRTQKHFYRLILIDIATLLLQSRIDYKQCYIAHRKSPSPATLSMYVDSHNAYVQQLHATNAMMETYHMDTIPQLTQELEDIYSELCTIVADGVLLGADAIATKVRTYVRAQLFCDEDHDDDSFAYLHNEYLMNISNELG